MQIESLETTAAGEWALLKGTSFLDAGQMPFVDRDGVMWWKQARGVSYWNGDVLKEVVLGWQVHAVVQDSLGAMWFFGQDKDSLTATVYDGGRLQTQKTKSNFSINDPVVVDGAGRFWMRAAHKSNIPPRYPTGYGAFEFQDGRWFHHTTQQGLIHDRVYDLDVDGDGAVWVATFEGVNRYADGKWQTYQRSDGMGSDKAYRVIGAPGGYVWVIHGNRGDISIFDGEQWHIYGSGSGMPVDELRAMLCTQDGFGWFGMHPDDIDDPKQSGLVRYNGSSWMVFAQEDGLPGTHVLDLRATKEGALLLEVPGQALVRFQPDSTQWGHIVGVVQKDDWGVGNIVVQAQTLDGYVKASTVSKEDGSYTLKVLPGHYQVAVPDAFEEGEDVVVSAGETVVGIPIKLYWNWQSSSGKMMLGFAIILVALLGCISLVWGTVKQIAKRPLKDDLLSDDPNRRPLYLSFHGSGGSLFGIFIVNTLLTMLTLGVYYFWSKAKIRRYLYSQTELGADRFANHMTGGELFVGWIKAIVLIVAISLLSEVPSLFWFETSVQWVTMGIFYFLFFLFFLPLAIVGSWRFRLSRTAWRGIRFTFRGNSKAFFKMYYVGLLKTIFSLGFYYPYFEIRVREFLIQKAYFGTQRLHFEGQGRDLVWYYVLAWLLTPFTLGLYWFWYDARKTRYYWRQTTFQDIPFYSNVTGSRLMTLKVGQFHFIGHHLGLGLALGCSAQQQVLVPTCVFV